MRSVQSTWFEPNDLALYERNEDVETEHERPTMQEIYSIREQGADKEILDLKIGFKMEQKKYLIMDKVVYYFLLSDVESVVRLYVPSY